jgi:hypothetical protein
MAGSEKTKAGLRDRLRKKRAARKQRAAERARSGAQNPVPRNAQHHAYDNGSPFGGSGG